MKTSNNKLVEYFYLTDCAYSAIINPPVHLESKYVLQIRHHSDDHSIVFIISNENQYQKWLYYLDNTCTYTIKEVEDGLLLNRKLLVCTRK